MATAVSHIRDWQASVRDGWDRFWFTPAEPQTLALIRILAGAMLFYTHLVWAFDLSAFLGPDSWITASDSAALGGEYTWSYLRHVNSPALLWTLHLGALAVFAMLTLGLFTRVVSILAWIITLAYCHRLQGALFGLDQVNAMLAMYLMIGPSGAAYSLDRWLARRREQSETPQEAKPSVGVNVAIRLIQLHLCIIYLFGGIGKMRGELWWDGSAVWFAVASLEYQSMDMTWLGRWPILTSLLTHVTVLWETFYCFLVWPRLSRPIVLAIAVAVHGGIALFLGMITFGLAMMIANLAFISPAMVKACVGKLPHRD